MPNRLAAETSPYLLQHRDNPVDWYPWGPEALEAARRLDRPILLSVGYSACHWCHVMERESFEDPETAAFLNEHFVSIKVDREERPDIDALYMQSVQEISGQGGWPMTVYCDPDGIPIYAGTYFPADEGHGMPSFRMVSEAVLKAFEEQRDELRERAPAVRERLGEAARIEPAEQSPDEALLEASTSRLLESLDSEYGGFGGAPKFPPPAALELLLARGITAPVEQTLDAMMAGGIHDQLRGGFARYAVDAAWRVPHFEKMLYDNAQLARVYLHAWQVLGHRRYLRVCERILDWMLAEMRGPEGGFFAALDADSEGEEGRFYTWTADEFRAALDPAFTAEEIDELIAYLGVTEQGNFEGRNVLYVAPGAAADTPKRLYEARCALLEARSQRVRPGVDDKRLAAWNALAIGALAEAGAVLERVEYLDAARGCANFVLTEMKSDEGRLLRTYKDGEARLNAYLEDHAFLIEALLTLYEATFERRWFTAARELAETMIARFGDERRGGFFSTSDDHEELVARRKEIGDHPIPSGNSSAALGLLRLHALSRQDSYRRQADGALRLAAESARRRPEAFADLLRALDFHLADVKEIALVGDELNELAHTVRSAYTPHAVLAGGPPGTTVPELLSGHVTQRGRPTAHVCEHSVCRPPVTLAKTLRDLL